MNRERLEDYDAQEAEYSGRIFKEMETRGLDSSDRFPELNRFSTLLKEPVVIADRMTYHFDKVKIWSQIPFAGTLVIPLHNIPKKDVLTGNAFDVSDITRLVDLAKETGRVQFGLAASPRFYEGLDHLDPILEGLRPPVLQTLPYSSFKDAKTVRLWMEEFRELSRVSYYKYVKELISSSGHENWSAFLEATMLNREGAYTRLKVLGMESLLETISNALIDDPKYADAFLMATTQATDNLFSGLRADNNLSLNRVKYFGIDSFPIQKAQSGTKYPIEIGRFLMEKIALNPSSYYDCLDVILHYEQNDLYKVLKALDQGIREQSADTVAKNVGELYTIMDNMWADAQRIDKSGKVIQSGFRVAIGMAGLGLSSAFVPPIAAAGVGLLAQLGLNVADQYMDVSGIGNKVAKSLNKRYVTTIYNFTHEHSLKR